MRHTQQFLYSGRQSIADILVQAGRRDSASPPNDGTFKLRVDIGGERCLLG
jgi:hypothetical protein